MDQKPTATMNKTHVNYEAPSFTRFVQMSVLAWLLTLGIFIADALTPLSIAVAVLYGIVILLISPFWSQRAVLAMTVFCLGLTVLAYSWGHSLDFFGPAFGRCLVSLTAIALIGFLVRRGQATTHALRHLNSTLEERIAARTEELKRTYEELQQSQKLEAIGQLTGGVAHDFNNLLQVVISNLQLTQMELEAAHPSQRRLEAALYAADRGTKLASHLLAFARRQPLQPKATNLGRILRGMDELLRRALGESIRVETVVGAGLWIAEVDPHQLENVILNIALNARDAMNGEGNLTLEVGNVMLDGESVSSEADLPAGNYVMLAISDTGCGMPPEVLKRVFDPFFTTKREGEGTGLGLSMVFGFVKQSNGHIRIYSEVGSGTTIKIYLPSCAKEEEKPVDSKLTAVQGGNETILVVEDDLTVQATAVELLTKLGYRVLKADNGQGAMTVLQSGIPVDLLFTDVVMPGPLRSPDLARQAKRLLPNLQVLFTSGYTQNAIVHGGRLDPGLELITKPYRREDLARKIRLLLDNAKPPLNRVPDALTAPTTHLALPSLLAPLRILTVEDNPQTLTVLCEILVKLGHHVQGVSTAEKALQVLDTTSFDVLLTDVHLPGMSGVDLARKAFATTPSIQIVLASGDGRLSDTALDFGVLFLPKPYTIVGLNKILQCLKPTARPCSDRPALNAPPDSSVDVKAL